MPFICVSSLVAEYRAHLSDGGGSIPTLMLQTCNSCKFEEVRT